MMKKTLFQKALGTCLYSRFVARSEDFGRALTDEEVKSEANYLLETISCGWMFEGKELAKAKAQLKRLLNA